MWLNWVQTFASKIVFSLIRPEFAPLLRVQLDNRLYILVNEFAAIHHLNRPRLSLSDLVAQSAE